MSADFIALFEAAPVHLNAAWLLAQLTAHPEPLIEVVERYKDSWRSKAWAIGPSTVTGGPNLVGPGGFSLHLRRHTIELYHMMRFGDFTRDQWSRNALRRACLFIADLVGSERAIYTHELMPYDDEDMEQIEAGLRTRVGPPASNFEELDAAEHFRSHAWYIDTLSDLRSR